MCQRHKQIKQFYFRAKGRFHANSQSKKIFLFQEVRLSIYKQTRTKKDFAIFRKVRKRWAEKLNFEETKVPLMDLRRMTHQPSSKFSQEQLKKHADSIPLEKKLPLFISENSCHTKKSKPINLFEAGFHPNIHSNLNFFQI